MRLRRNVFFSCFSILAYQALWAWHHPLLLVRQHQKKMPSPWYDLTICIITNANTESRVQSLVRLLNSLVNADYSVLHPKQSIKVHVSMDSATSAYARDYVENHFKWEHGPVTAKHKIHSQGLIAAVTGSWYPQSEREVGLLLEDDIELSPLWFYWAHSALTNASPQHDPRIVGISLYTPRRVEVSKLGKYGFDSSKLIEEITGDPTTPYFHQLPCSWGAIYYPTHWKMFLEYMSSRLLSINTFAEKHSIKKSDGRYSELLAVYPPNLVTPGWQASWKKFMVEIMYVEGWYMLYPSYPNQVSFSTNHLEVGEHITVNDTDHKAKDYTVPLMQLEDLHAMRALSTGSRRVGNAILEVPVGIQNFPILDPVNMPMATLDYLTALRKSIVGPLLPHDTHFRYSYWSITHNRVETAQIDRLTSRQRSEITEQFPPTERSQVCDRYHTITNGLLSTTAINSGRDANEGVTLLISTIDRLDVLRLQLEYYSKSPLVRNIMVTWNNPKLPVPPSMIVNEVMVQYLSQKEDSLNSRFHPNMRITTEAVIVMDDDIKIGLDDIELVFRAWGVNKDKIIGFYPRRLVEEVNTGNRVYSWDGIERFDEPYSMMLTKFMVIHKKYLYMYSCGLNVMQRVRMKVQEVKNCEDIAMNHVVAFMEKSAAPLFVEPLDFVGDFGDNALAERTGVSGAIHTRVTTKLNHREVRSECVRHFLYLFGMSDGGLPTQRYKVRTSRDVAVESLVHLNLEEMGTINKVHGFTATCGFDAKVAVSSFHSNPQSWKPIIFFDDKFLSASEACNFEHVEQTENITFTWPGFE